jgi:predicted dehydrogenase
LRWRDADGGHALRLPPARPADLLARFAEAVTAGQTPWPDFEVAYRALAWWRAALRSHAEGRRVEVAEAAPGRGVVSGEREGEAAGDQAVPR